MATAHNIDPLIARWRNGDQRAAEALYNTFQASTFRLAYGLLGNVEDAEEATQDALAYALGNIRRYDASRAAFGTWLHTITVSRCRDRLRRKRLHRISLTVLLDRGSDVPADGPGPENTTNAQEVANAVWCAIQTLSQPQKEAIVLRYWAGLTYREIAAILACSVPTAQSRVRLAYRHLRHALAPAHLAALAEVQQR